MISISPLSGFKYVTGFTFTDNSSASDHFVNWGDDTFSYQTDSSHVYSAIGLYDVYAGSQDGTASFYLSVYDGEYFTNKIEVSRTALSSVVSCPFTFNINLSSDKSVNTVVLYASGSKSSPYQETRNFWSHLNPEWEFLYNGTQISQLEIIGKPVYSGSSIIGYSANSAVSFLDDMPGNPVLFFTVQNFDNKIPNNSRVYSAFSHSICAVAPDKLFITADGINPLNSIQWSDQDIPYIISVGSSQISCTNILHYISGNIMGIDFKSGCYGMSLSAIQFNSGSINLFDSDCFPTGGYTLSSFFYPGSSLPPIITTNNSDKCNANYDKIEFYKTRYTPIGVSLSATGKFQYGNAVLTLTGQSEPFDLVAFENRHDFYRDGEDYTVYDIIRDSVPFELDQFKNFNLYLSAIAGPGDTLGKVYDKIHNFSKDFSDLEICTYESLIDKSIKLDSSIEDYGLEIPEELKRIFNFSTIPLQKLIGTRCVCNTNFVECQGCKYTNICSICKFDKRNNLGNNISLTEYITAGDTIIYKENGDQLFNFLAIQPQESNVFKLNTLSAEPIYSKGIDKFCFFRWDRTPQNNPVQSVVNYNDSRNMLNPSLSTNTDWYGDNGIVEEIFNYILTKNLLD
jgi:hypothetical protein